MSNVGDAERLLAGLVGIGVREFCVCAGSRNSPLLAVLGTSETGRIFSFVDERAAAFFALGRIRLHGRPVVVVTTSGTAVAELLPATIEAFYARLPLVMVTADRPSRFRDTGAPQCIDQVSIFGNYAESSLESWSHDRPLHLNVEFDEPLIDGVPARGWDRVEEHQFVADVHSVQLPDVPFERPLIVIGGLREAERDRVRDFALRLNRPVYAEPLSGLREDDRLDHLLIRSGERILSRVPCDGIIRIGDVPVTRFWRDLEETRSSVPVIHFTRTFPGLTRGDLHPLSALPSEPAKRAADDEFIAVDREMALRLETLVRGEPQSEVAMFRALSEAVPAGARIYLGNSLPIREWDLAATRSARGLTIEANRGANGIDGQVASFFGQCDPARSNICIVGDLTAIYDSNAGWIVPQLDPATQFTIYVVNNGGGRIFSRVASLSKMDPGMRQRIVENSHDLHFEAWAGMWSFAYGDRSAKHGVVELEPDLEASERFWEGYDRLWSGE